MIDASYEGGFTDPAHQSAKAFRAAMRAMARPGTVETITGGLAPSPLSPAAASLILTLCDPETCVYLAGVHDTKETRAWIAFHTGAPCVDAASANFALGTWDALQPLNVYPIGTSEYPDRGVTLIVEQASVETSGASLSGPGIKTVAQLNLPETAAFQANRKLFPRGFDCFFTAGEQIAALPRSTKVSEAA